MPASQARNSRSESPIVSTSRAAAADWSGLCIDPIRRWWRTLSRTPSDTRIFGQVEAAGVAKVARLARREHGNPAAVVLEFRKQAFASPVYPMAMCMVLQVYPSIRQSLASAGVIRCMMRFRQSSW